MKKNLSKFLALLLSLLMLTTFFSGCSKSSKPEGVQEMVYNLGAEPETIDPTLNTAVDGGTVIINCFEGLTRLDSNGVPGPGVAKSWDISDDKTVYTFHLRKDAKWSDGTPLTAKDFDYSWRRAIAPETKAEYITQMVYIKNAEALNTGKCKPEDLGVKILDDYTLEVTLESQCPYFLELCAFPTYMPLKKDIVDANPEGWATKPETYIGNGPFIIESWTNNDAIVMVKNTNYWGSKDVILDKLTFVMVVEESPALMAFEKGDIDYLQNPPVAELERLKKEGKLQILPELSTYYINFNVGVAPLNDVRIRKALSLALNRQQLCDNVFRAGEVPAGAFVPNGVKDADGKSDFRTVGGDFYNAANGDLALAKQLLAEAGYPDGKGFPVLTYCFNTKEIHKAVAEAVQDMWKKNLNIDVKVENLEWGVFIPKRQNGDYQIARGGWAGDYMDAMTFLDLFTSMSGNNDPQYRNPVYDDLIAKAKRETDSKKRWEYMHQAEKLLIETDWVIAPIQFGTNSVCVKPYAKGIDISPLGFSDFDRAYIDHKVKGDV